MSNVLVYSGPGVSSSALSHTLKTLRFLLPSYDVQCVNAQSLAVDPWMSTTSLLVLPGGRDLPFVDLLGKAYQSPSASSSTTTYRADARIREYVYERGGSFLGICAGAYYASSHCDFERGDEVMQVVGDRPALQFFPGTCQGTVFPGFVYESDKGARLVDVKLSSSSSSSSSTTTASSSSASQLEQRWTTYYNGGGAFINAEQFQSRGIEVIGRYMDEDEETGVSQSESSNAIKPGYAGQAAVVRCTVGKGKALLYGTHPEFPLSISSKPTQQTAAPEVLPSQNSLEEMEIARLIIFGQQLQSLGLDVQIPQLEDPNTAHKLTPILLSGREADLVASTLRDLQAVSAPSPGTLASLSSEVQSGLAISDTNDTMHFYDTFTDPSKLFDMCKIADYSNYTSPVVAPTADEARAGEVYEVEVDMNKVPKCILAVTNASDIPIQLTPHWNAAQFYNFAQESRRRVFRKEGEEAWVSGRTSSLSGPNWAAAVANEESRLADLSAYAQVVTSTQTMLDKNYKLLTHLPNGFTFFATHQVSGRGRGKNAWISPLGCLQFSTVLHFHPSVLTRSGTGGVVFVQYLAGLAIVESVRSGMLGPEYAVIGEKMRIKWPNDVYAEVGSAENEGEGEEASGENQGRKGTFVYGGKRYAKMAGVLVNSQFAGKKMSLVVGCGINTLNPRPTTSLSDLIQAHNNSTTRREGEARAELPQVSQEQFAGAILATFERMWNTFVNAGGSFDPFIEAYRRAWLHSDQVTTLSDTNPPTIVKIVGITSDFGLLRSTTALGSQVNATSRGSWSSSKEPGQWIDLQPDGNSFDMLQNLIRRKE